MISMLFASIFSFRFRFASVSVSFLVPSSLGCFALCALAVGPFIVQRCVLCSHLSLSPSSLFSPLEGRLSLSIYQSFRFRFRSSDLFFYVIHILGKQARCTLCLFQANAFFRILPTLSHSTVHTPLRQSTLILIGVSESRLHVIYRYSAGTKRER